MRRTPSSQRVDQMREIVQPLRWHLQNIPQYEFLDICGMDTPAAAAEFDAVDDEVVVVCDCLCGVCQEVRYVFWSEGCGERMVR